ncbi:MAG: carbohydrate ABC transporter permease [Chloroflexi bacterium]|nr:carbohydrate ABC transporter permease [Chloroflexota bacterium]
MISTSLKTPASVFNFPPQWIPEPVMWDNYHTALVKIMPFGLYYINTTIITAASIVGKVLSRAVVAFAFARLRWWGRDVVFILMLSTMMLPPQVTLIPQFIIFRSFGWIDTFWPLIVPAFFGGAFYTFLLRQFFLTIPLEMDDAARIDGASNLQIFARIILPLSKPALAAVAIFTFTATWNEFLTPLIYLHSKQKLTVALALSAFRGEYSTSWHLLMAASLVAMLPPLLVFFFAQKYFIQGVVFTGVKS